MISMLWRSDVDDGLGDPVKRWPSRPRFQCAAVFSTFCLVFVSVKGPWLSCAEICIKGGKLFATTPPLQFAV